MNIDDTFFNALTDFRDVKVAESHPHARSKDSCVSSHSHSSALADYDLDFNNNDKLLKNFKQLREQLKQSNKFNQVLRNKLNERESEIDRIKVSEKDHIAMNYQLKHDLERAKSECQEYRCKLKYLKETAKQANKCNEELEYLKMNVCELKRTISSLQGENKKIMEISVVEKVELEEKIKMMEAKDKSEVGYVQDMEIQVSKLREKCIKLENELKKAEIKYDEELYNKKWMNGNFEREHLEQQLKQATRDYEELMSKNKKQKEKRNGLEKRVLQLEELSGLWTVKAETFELENKTLNKKFKKMEKKMQQLKETADRKVAESLAMEQKFLKAVNIADELISRVKRDLIGDAVTLAKSCEYKLGKLKEDKEVMNTFYQKESTCKKSPAIVKGRSKSKPTVSPTRRLFAESPLEDRKTTFQFAKIEPEFNRENRYNFASSHSTERKFSEQTSQSNAQTHSPLAQIDNIELKIRRERQEMERKIREKRLYQQIEVANSPEKYRLREDYFRLIEK